MSDFLTRRRTILLLVGLTWLAFGLRIYHLTYQSLWRDEVDALRFATQPLSDLIAMFRKNGENGPFFFLALRPWLAVAGQSEFALRFSSVWASTLAVPVIYTLVRRLTAGLRTDGVRQITAAGAALLMAVAPYQVWYGQEAKMYAALTLLVPLGLLLAVEISQRGGFWRWVLLYVITSLSFYTHLLAVLALPVQALWLWLLPTGADARKRRLHALIYLAILVLPYLPLARWEIPAWLAGNAHNGYKLVPLPDILTVLAVAFSRGVLPVTQPATLLPFVLALLAGVGLWVGSSGLRQVAVEPTVGIVAPGAAGVMPAGERRARRLEWRVVGMLLIWLLLPPIEIYIVSLGLPIFLDRYLIWVMPAFMILVALGVVALVLAWRPLGLVTLAALLALCLTSLWAQTTQPIKADFRAAVAYVSAHQRPGDLLIFQIPYNRYTYTYYRGEGFQWLDGPYTNNGMGEADVADYLQRGTAATQAVWLVESEVSLWDERQLTLAWLTANGTVTDRGDFARVSVTRYALRR